MNSNHRPPIGRKTRPALAFLTAMLLAPGLTSCVSETQMRVAIEERDREISTLRADKTELQERLSLLRFEKEDLSVQLKNALAQVGSSGGTQPASFTDDVPPAQPKLVFPDLADLGIETTQRASGDTVISVPAEISFASGKAELSSGGRNALLKVASRLQNDFPKTARFWIEGHTDSDPIRRSGFESNRQLAWMRASAVHKYLVENGDVPDDRFVVASWGQYSPVASNSGPGKAKNRRVEIVVKAQ